VLLAKINKKTVGWGLLEIKEPAWMKLYNYGADDPQAYIMLYVQRKYRRRGISTKICARAHLISAEYNTRLIGYTGLANQIIEKSA
jgi:hypothetical protein